MRFVFLLPPVMFQTFVCSIKKASVTLSPEGVGGAPRLAPESQRSFTLFDRLQAVIKTISHHARYTSAHYTLIEICCDVRSDALFHCLTVLYVTLKWQYATSEHLSEVRIK